MIADANKVPGDNGKSISRSRLLKDIAPFIYGIFFVAAAIEVLFNYSFDSTIDIVNVKIKTVFTVLMCAGLFYVIGNTWILYMQYRMNIPLNLRKYVDINIEG